ncbi:uncharacterized protein Pyn_39152 [Prunus yedoensis var. nudiflora]|uniref:Transcription termination factor MTEF1 chloroplastic n=1 Tax=Prunus yedoensis var. nudiflora TaxID=2094558 RepID=A0A314UZA4_PRUYE|nr:uncharacterized protein Pyn_39152 [Prunus yedoensis var. nudiflora]
MGVDAGKALSQNPSLHTASLHSIHSIISFLQSKGIQKDLPKIFGMCPNILTSSIKSDLNPVFIFLSEDLKVPEHSFRKVINKCPRLLACSVIDQLKPAMFYLQRLGFKDLDALAYHDSVLLVSSVEKTLIPKLEFLQSLGFPRDEAVGMVLRCPGLLTFSIENNFKPKFEYFSVDMGKKLEELKQFPQYFAFSLEKRIKPRHMEVVQRGVEVPLPLMLKSTDDEFRELLREFGVDEMSQLCQFVLSFFSPCKSSDCLLFYFVLQGHLRLCICTVWIILKLFVNNFVGQRFQVATSFC